MTKFARHPGLFTALGLALSLAARADTTLAPTSPFLPPEGATAAAAENQPLELRGIIFDGGGYRFSVYDPTRHTGQWVRLNEPGHEFTVKTHDASRDTVTVDFQGRVLTLPLHTAKVVGLALPDPTAGPRPTGGTPGTGPVLRAATSGTGPMPKAATPEEAARFNRAVEEINRRRALREKGTGPGPMPQAKPN
jgi:hypothetical protein